MAQQALVPAESGLDTGHALRLPVVIRDFDTTHVNFENPECGQRLIRGMVADTLGPDRRPMPATPSTCPTAKVREWFTDHAANRRYCRDLPMQREPGSDLYTFDRPMFFPIDDVPGQKFPGDDGRPHNFHFCLETHAVFEYRGGETMVFNVDDDIFVYVNNKLAVDLGGNHGRLSDLIDLDGQAEALGLRKGNHYPLDIFYCDRATSNAALSLRIPINALALAPMPRAGPLQVGDGQRNVLQDTLVLHARQGLFTFTALRPSTSTHGDGCASTVLPQRLLTSAQFNGLGALGRVDSTFTVNTDSLVPGTYTLTLSQIAGQEPEQAQVIVVVKSAELSAPVASPRSSMACGTFRVTLTSPDSGATLWYTTGDQPFTPGLPGSWQRYMNAPIELIGDAITLRFVAVKAGYPPSAEGKELYLRDQTAPPVLLPPGENVTVFPSQARLAATAMPGLRIRYRLADQDERPDVAADAGAFTVYDPARGITVLRPSLLTATAQSSGCRESAPLVASLGMPQLPAPAIHPASQVFWPELAGIRAIAPDTATLLFVAVDSGLGRVEQPAWRLQTAGGLAASTGAGIRWGSWGPWGYTARQTVTVRAMAHRRGYRNSEVTERRYVLSDLRALSASFKDLDGDGRIETGDVVFNFALPRPPRMLVRDPWQGKGMPAVATLEPNGPSKLRLRFAPLPLGTGFSAGPWIEIVRDSLFAGMVLTVNDSAPPVLLWAESHPRVNPKSSRNARWVGAEVMLGFSEPVLLQASQGSALPGTRAWPFIWTRSEAMLAGSALLTASTLAEGLMAEHAALFEPSQPYPAPGDSLWPLNTLRDAAGLGVRVDRGVQVQGEAPIQASSMVWHAPRQPTSFQALETHERLPGFVITDASGLALNPNPENQKALAYQGPLLSFPVAAAGVRRIRLKAFDHLGQAVNTHTWPAYPEENQAVQNHFRRQGEQAQLHLRWTPISSEGRSVATGVYILWGEVDFEAGISRDAYGQPAQRKSGRATFGPMRIGVIRE